MVEVLPHESEGGKRKSPWVKTPTPNLIRYAPSGTYYLRARIGKNPHRESLGTKKYAVAKAKLPDRLRMLRARAGAADDAPDTLRAALVSLRDHFALDPSVKDETRDFYRDVMLRLGIPWPRSKEQEERFQKWSKGRKRSTPERVLDPIPPPAGPINKVAKSEMAAWWARVAAKYAPQQANHVLMVVRRAIKLARRAHMLADDPSEDLKRVKQPQKELDLPSMAEFQRIVAEIRNSRHRWSEQSANWVEFMAYTGFRPKEMRAVEWRHIHEDAGFIEMWGGTKGTKNYRMRPVPIIPPMRELLKRMRGDFVRLGPVFSIIKPHYGLWHACDRAGLKRQRVYNLRHLFATACLESGVDVPTFAKWLGHRDGGALAMRTYVHPRDEHRALMAAKVTFA